MTQKFFTNEYNQMLCPPKPLLMEPSWKPAVEIAPNCPRCASTNTKFCYYNNYSLSQPRYFCKACRRYWTKGGSLRNVPVGGGCRKSRRAKSSRHEHNRSSSSLSSSSSSESLASDQPAKDIDIAAVFANFLNQDTNVAQQDIVGPEMSNSRNQENVHGDVTNNTQCCNPSDDNFLVESELFSGLEGHEINEFELQSLLGDEVMSNQDVVWCDNATLPGFFTSWQQQEFGHFGVSPDEVEVSANNVINGNWDPLDLSSFEVFSRSNLK